MPNNNHQLVSAEFSFNLRFVSHSNGTKPGVGIPVHNTGSLQLCTESAGWLL